MLGEIITQILKKYNIKITVKYHGLDAEIANSKEIEQINQHIYPLEFRISGGYIELVDTKQNKVIDSIDFYN